MANTGFQRRSNGLRERSDRWIGNVGEQLLIQSIIKRGPLTHKPRRSRCPWSREPPSVDHHINQEFVQMLAVVVKHDRAMVEAFLNQLKKGTPRTSSSTAQ